MKNNFEKTFSTGEFAKLLEINKNTLLYYDKIGLFKPAGTLDNGYRYYTLEQFDKFIAIQSLRTVEFPIKALKTYFDCPNIYALQHLALEQHEKVTKEIQKLQDIQFFLARTVALTKEIADAPIGEVILKILPEEPIVYSNEDMDWRAPLDTLHKQSTSFLKKLGVKSAAAYGVVYPKEDFLHEGGENPSQLFCRLDKPTSKIKPGGPYAIIYYQGPYDEMNVSFKTLLTYLEHNQLEMDSDIYEEYLLHSIASKEENDYITKISVKVKPQESQGKY